MYNYLFFFAIAIYKKKKKVNTIFKFVVYYIMILSDRTKNTSILFGILILNFEQNIYNNISQIGML